MNINKLPWEIIMGRKLNKDLLFEQILHLDFEIRSGHLPEEYIFIKM